MIVIPMSGKSSRFFKAGYTQPKYELDLKGMPLFDHCLNSFQHYFERESFLFIARQDFEARSFIELRCNSLGIQSFSIVELDQDTRGQADTVAIGLKKAAVNLNEPITIFNIDTIRPHYQFPKDCETCAGYLEVFRGEGDNWSFAKAFNEHSNRVQETAEKKPISNLCSTGLYYFQKTGDFLYAFSQAEQELEYFLKTWKELYIAPLYNYLIGQNMDIRYHLINQAEVVFCGTPSEYLVLQKGNNT